jgi:hypothetical protein
LFRRVSGTTQIPTFAQSRNGPSAASVRARMVGHEERASLLEDCSDNSPPSKHQVS